MPRELSSPTHMHTTLRRIYGTTLMYCRSRSSGTAECSMHGTRQYRCTRTQESGAASRNTLTSQAFGAVTGQIPNLVRSCVPAEDQFRASTRQVLAQLPEEGYFLWVHVLTPHSPYLPDPPDRGRFGADTNSARDRPRVGPLWQPYYNPDQQSEIDPTAWPTTNSLPVPTALRRLHVGSSEFRQIAQHYGHRVSRSRRELRGRQFFNMQALSDAAD